MKPTTKSPTKKPTTKNPTIKPTQKPTVKPTLKPTSKPTTFPTKHPVTPSPTIPGSLICGDSISGEYNDKTITFYVQIQYEGTMKFDASLSTFSVAAIEGYTYLGTVPIAQDSDNDEKVTLNNVPAGNYRFLLAANPGISGTFVVRIQCQSNNPTSAPTKIPTLSPNDNPTVFITLSPNNDPTGSPTERPTDSMTVISTKFMSTLNMETTGKSRQSDMNSSNSSNSMSLELVLIIIGLILIFCVFCFCAICVLYKLHKKKQDQPGAQMMEMQIQQNINLKTDNDEDRELVANWFKNIGLPQYYPFFIKNGYDSLRVIASIQSKEELKEIGVSVMGHRTLIFSEIAKLQKNQTDATNATHSNSIYNGNRGEGLGQIYQKKIGLPAPPTDAYDDNERMSVYSVEGPRQNTFNEDIHDGFNEEDTQFNTKGFIGMRQKTNDSDGLYSFSTQSELNGNTVNYGNTTKWGQGYAAYK